MKKNLVSFLAFIIVLSSCVSRRNINYLQELDEVDIPDTYENVRKEKVIQVYDKLYIKIYNIDPNINNLFQDRVNMTQNVNLMSYTVNEKGVIDFPYVGNINLQGLTLEEAKIELEKEFNKYMPNTSIIVRFVGNVITVIGEVNRQGEYSFVDDKINIFQALSYASGINNYGDKSNVTVIREINNQITYHELDLSKKSIVESSYYYLNPNDVVVVKPIKAKYRTYRDFALISVVLSSVTTLIVVLSYLNQ